MVEDNIIDFKEKLKKKLEEENKFPEFYKRFINCLKKQQIEGTCSCEICLTLEKMSDKMINYGQQIFVDYMKEKNIDLFYGDLLTVFIMSTLRIKEFCSKEFKDEKS